MVTTTRLTFDIRVGAAVAQSHPQLIIDWYNEQIFSINEYGDPDDNLYEAFGLKIIDFDMIYVNAGVYRMRIKLNRNIYDIDEEQPEQICMFVIDTLRDPDSNANHPIGDELIIGIYVPNSLKVGV